MRKIDENSVKKNIEKLKVTERAKLKEVQELEEKAKQVTDKCDKEYGLLAERERAIEKELVRLHKLEEELKKKETKINEDYDGITQKRIALDKLAEMSDQRLREAEEKELNTKRLIQDLKKMRTEKDKDIDTKHGELVNKVSEYDNKLKQLELERKELKDKLILVGEERESAERDKKKYEDLVKEVETTKRVLTSQLNQSKDAEQEAQKAQKIVKEREKLCDTREAEIKDEWVKILALQKKVNNKIEIHKLKKELGIDGEIHVQDGTVKDS